MLVNFKRMFFASDGASYGPGTAEISPDLGPFPRDAVILSEDGTLPSPGTPTKAGYGGKPEHEQILDQIPGAAPTHQIARVATAADINPVRDEILPVDPTLADEQRAARIAELRDRHLARVEDLQASTVEGLEKAKAMATRIAEASGDESRIREAEAINVGSGGPSPDEAVKLRDNASDTTNLPPATTTVEVPGTNTPVVERQEGRGAPLSPNPSNTPSPLVGGETPRPSGISL